MIPNYRAWDKEDKRMSYGEIEYYDDSFGVRFDHFCVGADFEVEFMQSTGAKDKNGAEIYEDDIVSVTNHPFQKHKNGVGMEIEGNYRVNWNKGGLNWLAGNLYLARLKPYIEVIGNIYENPELLEVTR